MADFARMNEVYATLVHLDELAATLRPLFVCWRDGRRAGESFGDFCYRVGVESLRKLVAEMVIVRA